MSFPYSPYGLPYPPMPTQQYGAVSGAEGEGAPGGTPYATQYPPMPIPYTAQAMVPPVMPSVGGHGQVPSSAAPQLLGPPVAASPGGTGVTPRPALGPPIAAYGPPGGTGQPAGYGPGGPADPSIFVHPGSGNRNQFGSGLAAYSPGPDVSDGGGGRAPAVPSGVQVSGDVRTGPRTGGSLLPAAADGGGVTPRPALGPPVAAPPVAGGAPRLIGPAVQKPPASVPNGATPVVGG